ncbi:Potassium transporter [Didymella pomorum]|uniref:Potassium transporter n=1 Tax=Didymella pomorum TaxID=749634 RepID=A0A9W9DA65_9PLEO|nr:Potassium transporter [Didymella pomorum]
MGCCGDREKGLVNVAADQKWDYINLSDFRSSSCLTPFSYAWLWILTLISCAVYAADAFTAVNLLAFNKWSSQVQPKVPFEVAKWIFAITIIISYVFLVYRGIRAFRVMRSGSVTECYLEPMAAIWQSMRLTSSGRGWRRFLVFAELTKSKKGANYIALFVYFQFKSALIIIIAQGPRIAINAMTLYAVMQAQLLPVGEHASEDRSGFEQFFMNIKAMIETGNKQETVVYFTMLFSLVIWVIAALGIIISCVLYIFFLWHYIPRSDGSLTNYCRRKVETRLARIVGKKMKKAIEKEDQKRKAEEQRAMKKGTLTSTGSKPTLPSLVGKEDDGASIYGIQRSDTFSTVATLPPYSSNAPSRTNTVATNNSNGITRKPALPMLNKRPGPDRSDTNFSTTSYGSNAPLLNQAGDMGMATSAPPVPHLGQNAYYYEDPPLAPPARAFTPVSQGRASPQPVLPQVDTNYSNGRYSPTHDVISPLDETFARQPTQPYTAFSPYDNHGPATGPAYELSPVDNTVQGNGSQHYYSNSDGSDDYRPPQIPGALWAGSPAMSQTSNMPLRSGTAPPPRAGTAPPRPGVPASLQSAIQRREASQPLPNRAMNGSAPPLQQRSVTAPMQQPAWNAPAQRSYTPSNLGSERSYTPAQRSYTPADRSYTPAERSYTPAERSYTPASTGYPPSNQRGYDNGNGYGY